MKPRFLKLLKISTVLFFPGRCFTFFIQTMYKRFLFKGTSKLITETYKVYTYPIHTFCHFIIFFPPLYYFLKQFSFYCCFFAALY